MARWKPFVCTIRTIIATAFLATASLAAAGVDLIEVGIDPPEPPPPPKLFAWVVPQEEPQNGYEAAWSIAIEQTAIEQPAEAIELNLPDRDPVIVDRLHWEGRRGYIPSQQGYAGQIPDPGADASDFSWRWYGKSPKGYTVALTMVEGNLAGRVWAPENVHYALEPGPAGSVLGLVQQGFWTMHPPATEEPPDMPLSAGIPAGIISKGGAIGSGKWDLTCSGPLPSGYHPIDVLVMYTPGIITPPPFGTGYANVTALRAAVQSALDDANQALRNVDIGNYVYVLRGLEPADPFNYDGATITTALDKLSGIQRISPPTSPWCTFPGNTYVASRRATMWADVVALARRDQNPNPLQRTCGVSRAQRHVEILDCPRDPGPGYSQFSYLVFDPACSADLMNFAHELGHVVGMEHDPKNAKPLVSPNKPSCPWSFGHRRADGGQRFRFHTIMAYAVDDPAPGGLQGPPQCASATDCPLIDAYSDPVLEWAGYDDGVSMPPFGLQPLGAIIGAWPIGDIVNPSWRDSIASDTLARLAPTVSDFYPRPDIIFWDGFDW